MARAEPHEVGTGISRRPEDADPDLLRHGLLSRSRAFPRGRQI